MAGPTPKMKYEKAKEYCLANPSSRSWRAVGRYAGIDSATAKRLYEIGIPSRNVPPIQHAVEDAQEAARAQLQREREVKLKALAKGDTLAAYHDALDAREDMAANRIEEGRMVRLSRENVVSLLETLRADMEAVRRQYENEILCIETHDDKGEAYTPAYIEGLQAQALERYINRRGKLARQLGVAVDGAERTAKLERLVLGEPTSITKHVTADLEAAEALKAAVAAMCS